ncbi:hypothetical protein GO755_28985 [Spirosoma sp. HMF4905]|uniref:Uncharacterized protein n=1 Tax=Spirosoma arboris TaxID=2682092 RepID=A0A7K1SK36_9BACT|nr:hypothetical protein [Spirosoma arboris]MVM34103.1 hypothetical protein [Spirosoma arboris]
MKRILSIVLSLTTFLAFGQNAEIGRQVSQNLRGSSLNVNALKADVINSPVSTTLSGNITISGINQVDKLTYHTLNATSSLFICIDPVNGSDTKDPSEYTVQTENFTGGVVFKTLDKAIEWINGSSGYSYFVSIRNTSSANPVVLSADHEVNNKYIILYSADYPTLASIVLNAGLFASTGTMLQLLTLDLTINGSNRIGLDGGDIVVQNSIIRPSVSCSNLYYVTMGRMYLDNSTYVFSANNQSIVQPSGGYGAQVSIGMHGPLVFTMGSFTGLSLISAAHRGYNLSVKCKDNATFPMALNIEGGLFQYGQTLVQGQAMFDPTNSNYKSVLHGPTPIRTPDMNSNSADLTGSLKTVVVDENGRFGVRGNRFTTVQRDALTPYEGLEIYNLTTHTKEFWNGTTWKTILTN